MFPPKTNHDQIFYYDKLQFFDFIEHLENPQKFHQELLRVGEKITYILPPLWDVTAVFNFLEHKMTMRKEHTEPPAFIRLPFADFIQKSFGQRIKS